MMFDPKSLKVLPFLSKSSAKVKIKIKYEMIVAGYCRSSTESNCSFLVRTIVRRPEIHNFSSLKSSAAFFVVGNALCGCLKSFA